MAFNQLPADICIAICYWLDPLDIMALSQTCSSIREASQERSVWTTAVKQSCSTTHILPATYKPNEMSLDELKHTSAGPSRIISKIGKGSSMGTEGSPHTLSSCSMHEIHLEQPRRYSHLCLIPGGRFLLAYGVGHVRDLILYDLILSQPVAEIHDTPIHIEYYDDSTVMACPSPDGHEIRVLMSQTLESGMELGVFRFNIDRQDPHERWLDELDPIGVISSWDSTFGGRPYTIVGDLVVFCDDPDGGVILGVWNYIQNTFAAWWIPDERYLEICVDGPHVVLISSTALRYWKIPPLAPQPKCRIEGPFQDIPETFIVPLNISNQGPVNFPRRGRGLGQIYCAKLFDWYNTFDRLPSFDFIVEVQDHETFMTFSLPTYDNLSTSLGAPPHLVTTFRKLLDQRRRNQLLISVSPYALCNGSTVKTFMEHGNVYITANTRSDPLVADPVVQLLLPDGFNADDPRQPISKNTFQFDPVSGRLAYLSNSRCSIVIADYLTYPS